MSDEIFIRGKITRNEGRLPVFFFDGRESNPDSDIHDMFSGYDPRDKTYTHINVSALEFADLLKDDETEFTVEIKVYKPKK